MTPPTSKPVANNLDAFWMPFTANRQFKTDPRLLVARPRACTTGHRTAAR